MPLSTTGQEMKYEGSGRVGKQGEVWSFHHRAARAQPQLRSDGVRAPHGDMDLREGVGEERELEEPENPRQGAQDINELVRLQSEVARNQTTGEAHRRNRCTSPIA